MGPSNLDVVIDTSALNHLEPEGATARFVDIVKKRGARVVLPSEAVNELLATKNPVRLQRLCAMLRSLSASLGESLIWAAPATIIWALEYACELQCVPQLDPTIVDAFLLGVLAAKSEDAAAEASRARGMMEAWKEQRAQDERDVTAEIRKRGVIASHATLTGEALANFSFADIPTWLLEPTMRRRLAPAANLRGSPRTAQGLLDCRELSRSLKTWAALTYLFMLGRFASKATPLLEPNRNDVMDAHIASIAVYARLLVTDDGEAVKGMLGKCQFLKRRGCIPFETTNLEQVGAALAALT